MKSFLLLGAAGGAMGANPIRRVVTLLQDMQKEVAAEGTKEEALYKKFMCYCKENNGSLGGDAKMAEETIAAKNAEASEKAALKKQTAEELIEHKKDRSEAKEALAQATAIRKKEKLAFDAALGDSKAYIEATTKAVAALEKGRGTAFLQSSAALRLRNVFSAGVISNIDAGDADTLLAFLQSKGDYHSVGGEIIGILKNMLEEFEKTQGSLISTEDEGVKNFGDLKAAKMEAIQAATSSIESKTELKGKLAVEATQAVAAADAAAKQLADAQEFLANLETMCADKEGEWQERQKERAGEVAAIGEAIKVLNDDDALDIFKKALPTPKPVAFLQTGVRRAAPALRAAEMLRAAFSSQKNSSPALALLAASAASALKSKSKVDFSKVITMIDDMIGVLGKESKDDVESMDMCEKDLASSAADKKETETKITSLTSEIAELENQIATGKANIEEKTSEIAQLDKAVKESTASRAAEKEDFEELVALNTSAVQLLEKAGNKLNQFYNPSQYKAPEERELTEEERILQGADQDIGDTTAQTVIAGTEQTTTELAQSPPPPPETFGAYKRKGEKSNSVMKLLDMLMDDLKKEVHTAEMEEKQGQKDFDALIADSAKSRSAASKVITQTETAVAGQEESLGAAKDGNLASQERLVEIKKQISNLHEQCDFIMENFEVRKEARVNEIEGLKNAKAVLSGANYGF